MLRRSLGVVRYLRNVRAMIFTLLHTLSSLGWSLAPFLECVCKGWSLLCLEGFFGWIANEQDMDGVFFWIHTSERSKMDVSNHQP